MVEFSSLAAICNGVATVSNDAEITTLAIDSRKAIPSSGTLFFAIAGERHDGHEFLPALYAAGFRQFVIEKPVHQDAFPDANFLYVKSSIAALQDLAAYHRNLFTIPIIGITGSNGKTIIKEWLYQLLSSDYNVVKNPGSYNSQVGVPLSVWQIQEYHNLGIFESGISKKGEMDRLQKVIRPTIGIFTTYGPAHDEGFDSGKQKIQEKIKLFKSADLIVYCKDQREVASEIENSRKTNQTLLSWGQSQQAVIQIKRFSDHTVDVQWEAKSFSLTFPFSDPASIENVCHCVALMLYLGYSEELIGKRITQLKTIPMRLELKPGINHCQIIDDTYNNDLGGLQISLDFLSGLKKKKSAVILSDILQSGLPEDILMKTIAELIGQSKVNSFIGIGPSMVAQRRFFEDRLPSRFFQNTEEFLTEMDSGIFRDEVVLVKGARVFQFEKIVGLLENKIHGTVMEIDLGAMVHNLNFFRTRLRHGVKLMVMVKAFAYGSGSEEVANLLQYHQVDYLGVAFADEGVELRRNRVRLPILVMNPSEESFATIVHHALEPEIYSLSLLKSFAAFLNGKPGKIHFKIDSGMHRLGFEENELTDAIAVLCAHPNIEIGSIFSHLAGADEVVHDGFTRLQAQRFLAMAELLKRELKISPVLHILNSSGILRFPELQLDMVRLGIGLYGVNPTQSNDHLKVVVTLKTIISQIKTVKSGETIGYGRQGKVIKDTQSATLAIGYADGFSRMLGNGKGSVWINGKFAPVIGNVCMDMTMVDITGIDAKEGDEVIVFGEELPIDRLAKEMNTIPYEILARTSERVKRIFFAESI